MEFLEEAIYEEAITRALTVRETASLLAFLQINHDIRKEPLEIEVNFEMNGRFRHLIISLDYDVWCSVYYLDDRFDEVNEGEVVNVSAVNCNCDDPHYIDLTPDFYIK